MVFFKFFAAIQLVVVLFCSGLNNETAYDENYGGGHIEVIGDFLTGDTGSPDILIKEVVLSGSQNYSFQGCNKRNCSYNISNVEPGTYEVTLHGTNSYQYTEVEIVE